MTVAVLGCGPAGMMVAHALARKGADFVIYSDKKEKSRLGGAQYLHVPIPGVTDNLVSGELLVQHLGTAEGYAEKMGRKVGHTSWENYEDREYTIWSLQHAYDILWMVYHHYIQPVGHIGVSTMDELAARHKFVFSTIPKKAICYQHSAHLFSYQKVLIAQDEPRLAPENGISAMTYSGRPEDPWYRNSDIFGVISWEYPLRQKSPEMQLREIAKPLDNNCDCDFPGTFHFGRYGRWERSQLTHDAFLQAEEIVNVLF